MSPLNVPVRDVMSRSVVTLEKGRSLPLAEWLMRDRHVRHLPVTDVDGHIVGMVTHKTILLAEDRHWDEGMAIAVADIMSPAPISVSPDDSAADTAQFMVANKLGCALVVDDDDRLVGIVTEADFVELAAQLLFQVPRIAVDDFMTTDVVSMTENESLSIADELMTQGRFRHLPVVDSHDHLIGLVTHRDLLAARVGAGTATTVGDVEQRDVWSISSGSSARNAARMLADHAFGCLPVTHKGKLVGLITEADILELLVRLLTRQGAFRRPNLPLRFYMSAPVHCVHMDTSLESAREQLSRRSISALGVVSGENHLVGIISATDLIAASDGAATRTPGQPLVELPQGVVSERMTRDVIMIDVNTPTREAAAALGNHKIHRVFVTENSRLVGVVSTADIALAVRDMRIHTPLSEFMSQLVMTIGPGEDVAAGVRFLENAEIRALVVMEHGWPIGVLNQRHLLAAQMPTRDVVVEDVMSTGVVCLPEQMSAFRAAAQMAELGADHVVAIRDGKPVGVITGIDMAKMCARSNKHGLDGLTG